MNKKIVRLLLFIVLSFLPNIILVPVLNHVVGDKLFISGNASLIYAFGVFGMLFPSIAHILTRLLTKEGFKNLYLLPKFKGNGNYYAASVGVGVVYGFIDYIVMWQIFLPEFGISQMFSNFNGIAMILLSISFSVFCFFPGFGEEWGWRGYMMPRLIELVGKPWAVVLGGIIWGLWHAPLTIAGHNFGVDYPGYPYVGIFLMCVYCIAMNAYLTFLTEKTHSIYPASVAHIINNNVNMTVFASVFMTKEAASEMTDVMNNFQCMFVMLPVVLLFGGISFFLCIRKKS